MTTVILRQAFINDRPATGRLKAHLDELLVELDQVTNKQQRHEAYCRCGNLIAINATGVPPAYCRDCQEQAKQRGERWVF